MLLNMFAQRSMALEFMDTGEYTPEEYAETLHELRLVNRYIGDNWALENSLLADIKRAKVKEFSVLDIGAGSGELMRLAARFAKKK